MLFNLKHPDERVTFLQAVKQGLGRDQGLFFCDKFSAIDNIDALLEKDFISRSAQILNVLTEDNVSLGQLHTMADAAFNFPLPLLNVSSDIACLELFHGPTLAFKDFGGRFMAQCTDLAQPDEEFTILTATSGDTGAAVAHAFYNKPGVKVVVLYPKGGETGISTIQEKLFCTLGGNITTIGVKAPFDDCQDMVKRAFIDPQVTDHIQLNSANSINVSRLFAQVCYYFEAVSQARFKTNKDIVVAVPSGNFGNLTAGVIAKALGAPIKRFIAVTNDNDTVPRYLHSLGAGNKKWAPNPSVPTLSSAMDVSAPSNWPRIETLFDQQRWDLRELGYAHVSDAHTSETMKAVYAEHGYILDPHTAVGYHALENNLEKDEFGIVLGTAHPAKFKDIVDDVLKTNIDLPTPLVDAMDKEILSHAIDKDGYDELKNILIH